ncbi:MAG: IS21-like element helper ATPase IstB [Actinomycetota bacterium]|nr:IS21-like element helper ATPase IstB [Actinomycetota bacterium]
MTVRTEEAAEAAIDAACRELKLPTVRTEASAIANSALAQGLTHRAYLADVLAAEIDDRAERRRGRRVADAKFPRSKRLSEFDCSCSTVAQATVAALAAGAFIEHGDPVVFLGDSGTGKSHLLIGTGMAAAEAGKRVRYTTTAALVNELVEAADDRTLSRVIARYGRIDLLCLDELGYLSLDVRGAELLFQVLTEREEKRSVAAASNAPFSEWGRTFSDARLAGAVVDRLTFRSLIIETGSNSYRLHTATKTKRARSTRSNGVS